MKKLLLSALSTMLLFTACTKKPNNLTEKEVLAVINTFDSGWRQKNLQQVDEVLAPGYVYFTQSGGIFSREGVVQTAGSDSYTLDSMVRTDFIVQLIENTAIVSSRWRGRGIYRGKAFDENQRCSLTVIKLNGKIEILSEHCTPIRQASIFH